jgi:hypothetical protein
MRQWLSSVRPVTLALFLLNIGVVVALVPHVLRGTQVAALLATAPDTFDIPSEGLRVPDRQLNVDSLDARPLFHATRRMFVAVQAPSPPPARSTPDYRLRGTIVIPARPTVAILVNSTSGVLLKVTAGDAVDDWVVETVEAGRVILRHGQETFEVVTASPSQASSLQSELLPPSATNRTAAQPLSRSRSPLQ